MKRRLTLITTALTTSIFMAVGAYASNAISTTNAMVNPNSTNKSQTKMAMKKAMTNHLKAISVSSQQPQFEIKLKANPTTGYSWFLASHDSSMILPVSHKFTAPQNTNRGMVGVGGYEVWTFKLAPKAFVVPQRLTFSMLYTQPWNLKGGEKVDFVVITRK